MSEPANNIVVVGVDGSPESLVAVAGAAWEAGARGCGLRVVHAREWTTYAAVGPLSPLAVTAAETMTECKRLVGRALDQARHDVPELTVTGDVVDGGASHVLIEESRLAELVVVGTRGVGGFSGLLLGSTAVQVGTHAHCPVLVMRGSWSTSDSAPVVVGVDGGASADAAIGFAIGEARARGVPVHAIFVWHRQRATALDETEDLPEPELARNHLGQWLREWRERYPDIEVRAETVRDAEPIDVLTAASRQACLVVIGSRVRSEWTARLLGSTGYALVHRSHSPVAIVHSGDSDAA